MSANATNGVDPSVLQLSRSLEAAVHRATRPARVAMLALTAPSVAFVAFVLIVPIALFLYRAIDNSEIAAALPHTASAVAAWRTGDLPEEPVYAALVADLRQIGDTPAASALGRRLNYAVPGYRALIGKTVRQLPPVGESSKAALIALDAKWGNPAYLAVLKQQTGYLTSFYLFTALDLERTPDGALRQVSSEQAVFIDLYGRTLLVSSLVMLVCLFIGYPVAVVMASATPAAANWLLLLVLVPFWTSILVRTTAWVILLQNEGLMNKALVWLGLINEPVALVFNRIGVVIAMVHVLLPYMILPLYSAMRGISPVHLRAAASLGATPLRVFCTVYLPLSFPGVAAGCTLVFVMSIGYYVVPAFVGGPRDQMIGYFVAYFTNSAVNWGLASALGAFLLLFIALIYAILGRLVGFERLRVR